MGERRERPRTPTCGQALLSLAVALVALAVGAWLYLAHAPSGSPLSLQVPGDPHPWPPADLSALRTALRWNGALIAGYGVCLGLLTDLGTRVFYSEGARRLATAAFQCAVLAVVMDALETSAALLALGQASTRLLPFASAASVVKCCALLVAVPVALAAAVVVLRRSWGYVRRSMGAPEQPRMECVAPSPVGSGPADGSRSERWARGYLVPGLAASSPVGTQPDGGPQGDGAGDAQGDGAGDGRRVTGFCVSGGGVRSASVTLGALQGLRRELLAARYLVSVSGGGYTAGALQMALQPPPEGTAGRSCATPQTALMPGSVEEDHVRRHSSYIADGLAQWLVALGVLLRNLLFSLALLAVTAVAAGFVVGLFYRVLPVVPLKGLRQSFFASTAPPFPLPGTGARLALVSLGLVTLALYVVKLAAFVDTGGVSAVGQVLVRRSFQALLLVAVLTVAVPALLWSSVAVTTIGAQSGSGVGVIRGATGTVVLAYLATLGGILWRQRESIGKQLGWLRSKASLLGNMGAGLFQRLVVTLALILVAVLLLLILAAVAVVTADPATPDQASSFMRENVRTLVPLVAAVVVLGLTWLLVDQTWMSLHPFYRWRLASAFAVRPLRLPSGQVQARPYDYDHERTTLSVYGQRHADFPEVVFAAAANLSGQQRTPPGRRAVSFTMTGTWVGGPDVGYARTSDLEAATSEHIQRDLTVQAAVAVSGAAFASAMGRQARAFQTFFALTNARLGTWLPNPAFLSAWMSARREDADDWSVPSLPRLRRLNYLLREILGSFPCDDRFLFITDGGHYENLGLVELLRRRCTQIYCIDASGDTPPVAGTLADAIDLAYEELGVKIELDDQWALVPGGGEAIDPKDPLAPLNGRLSNRAVIRGTITYPPESGLPDGTTGRLVVAKAVLTRDMPYPLLAHAVRSPVFPNDSTTDQWFDDTHFTAYKALGWELARQVHEAEKSWTGAAAEAETSSESGHAGSGEEASVVAVPVAVPVTTHVDVPVTVEPPPGTTPGTPQESTGTP
ncbi:MAG: patatin-like phospholipase family protein [Actinomycetes bacterium]